MPQRPHERALVPLHAAPVAKAHAVGGHRVDARGVGHQPHQLPADRVSEHKAFQIWILSLEPREGGGEVIPSPLDLGRGVAAQVARSARADASVVVGQDAKAAAGEVGGERGIKVLRNAGARVDENRCFGA